MVPRSLLLLCPFSHSCNHRWTEDTICSINISSSQWRKSYMEG